MRPPSRWRLRIEFAILFLAAPLGAALFLPPDAIFPVLFAITAAGLGLLTVTPGFRWRGLIEGGISWRRVALFCGISAAISAGLVLSIRPEAWLMPGRAAPGLLLAIVLLYPILSALPQELVFRPLFFERYGPILPAGRAAIVLNAAIFAMAHLIYWNWVTLAMTFCGGLAFAHSYAVRRSFPEALALHALAGNLLFALGMGAWFYSGNVSRPF